MKINNITALDYKAQGPLLELELTDTTLEEITSMDAAILTVKTDAGDLVEAFAGFALRSVTYNPDNGVFRAELSQMAQDTTSAALAALEAKQTAQEAAQEDIMLAMAELAELLVAGTEKGV